MYIDNVSWQFLVLRDMLVNYGLKVACKLIWFRDKASNSNFKQRKLGQVVIAKLDF